MFNSELHELIQELDTVREDCEVQANALESRQDVSWDAYDVGNWRSMQETLEKVISKLKEIK